MTKDEQLTVLTQALAQLRHAYQQCIDGNIKNQHAFARGLLAPQIEKLERLQGTLAAQPPPDPDPYGEFVANVREAAEAAGWDGASNLQVFVLAHLQRTGPCEKCVGGRCGGLHDTLDGISVWCHCAGCEAARLAQGKRNTEMYRWQAAGDVTSLKNCEDK